MSAPAPQAMTPGETLESAWGVTPGSSPHWCLRQDVVIGASGSYAIVAGGRWERALRLTGAGCDLVTALAVPATLEQLGEYLAPRYPRHAPLQRQVAAMAFLQRLAHAGMLDDTQETSAVAKQAPGYRWRLRLPNPDPLAWRCARGLQALPPAVRHVLGLVLVVAILLTLLSAPAPHPLRAMAQLDGSGIAGAVLLALFWLLGHELSHAVACRLYGFPVVGAGIVLRGFILPSAYVNTSAVALDARRDVQFHVAMAGPAFDLAFAAVALGVISWWPPDHWVAAVASCAATVALLGWYFNMTPFRASDGSSACRALFADDHTQEPGWPAGVVFYGLYAATYLLMTAQLLIRLMTPWAL